MKKFIKENPTSSLYIYTIFLAMMVSLTNLTFFAIKGEDAIINGILFYTIFISLLPVLKFNQRISTYWIIFSVITMSFIMAMVSIIISNATELPVHQIETIFQIISIAIIQSMRIDKKEINHE